MAVESPQQQNTKDETEGILEGRARAQIMKPVGCKTRNKKSEEINKQSERRDYELIAPNESLVCFFPSPASLWC